MGSLRLSSLVVVSSLLLASCAQGTGDQETEASYDQDAKLSGKMTVMGFGTDDEVATTRLALAEKALGDDVEVKLVKGELDVQQFLAAAASGDAPALIYADRNQIGTFASRGAVIPLNDCIDGEQIDTSVYRESALDEVTFDGDIYGIPEFNVVPIVQANRDLLDEAGMTIDDVNGSDWDGIERANKAIAQADGGKISVIGYDSKLPEFLPLWVHANGGALISDDGRTAQLDSPEVVEALEFAVGIYDDQGGFGAVKAFRDSADFFGDGNQFASDTLGAMPMEQWYVNVLNEVSPDVPMTFDAFRDREGNPFSWASGSAWAIPAGSPEPEAACRFAKTMTGTDSWMAAAKKRIAERSGGDSIFTGLLTGNVEADEEVRALVKPSGSEVWDAAIEATYLANEHTFSMPANPAGNEFEQAWQDGVNRVLNGQQSPDEAMAQAEEEAQKALDEAWAKWDE
jgi:multiple sugar transport system substrate-binding protein